MQDYGVNTYDHGAYNNFLSMVSLILRAEKKLVFDQFEPLIPQT